MREARECNIANTHKHIRAHIDIHFVYARADVAYKSDTQHTTHSSMITVLNLKGVTLGLVDKKIEECISLSLYFFSLLYKILVPDD